MAGTEVPGCAEGLVKPAFKSTCLNKSPLRHPGGLLFTLLMETERTLPVPTNPLFIKFYMKSWVVNHCSERRRWREEVGVQRNYAPSPAGVLTFFFFGVFVESRCFSDSHEREGGLIAFKPENGSMRRHS